MHLVMFDIDGTLVDSDGFDGELYARAVHDVTGIEIDRSWETYRHVTDGGILAEVLAPIASGARARSLADAVKSRFIDLVEGYMAAREHAVAPIAGAATLIDALRDAPGCRLAIATGGWRETAELKLDAAGIDRHGIAFASGSDAHKRIAIMRLAEQRAGPGGDFVRRTYFGDGPWDLAAARELAWDFVAIGTRVPHAICFPDLSDRAGILKTLGV